jgi:diguanylate cyclase (GGDEF)-like protein/PAS domain S-box-containing protein
VANLAFTLRSRERLLLLERQLRQSVAELLQADTSQQVLAAGIRAIGHLVEGKKAHYSELAARRDGRWLTVPDGRELQPDDAELKALSAAVERWKTFREDAPSNQSRVRFVSRLVIPLFNVSQHAEVLIVEAAPVLTVAEIEQLQQVTAIIERALIAHDLQEEAHRRRADRRFKALVQDSGDIVALVDPSTYQVKLVGPSMSRILGYAEEDLVGSVADRYFHPTDGPVCRRLLDEAVTRPQTAAADLRVEHRDGHYHWFAVTVRDHTTDTEVRGLVMNLTDIQDRKMAEISLAVSEQRYRALVHNSKDVFAILEPELTINYISPNVEVLLGFSAPDLVASNLSVLLTEPSIKRLQEFIDNTRDVMQNDLVELELRTKSRQTRIAEVTLSARTDGVDSGFVITINDITDRRRLERSLRDQALYDGLTGLAKRSTLHFELQRRLQDLQATEYLALIHIDIDDFKAVNQSVGYEAGDELLVQVATRLRASLRRADYLARLGGNEFAVAVTAESRDAILTFAERLLALFGQPFEVTGKRHRLSVSIGVEITDDRRTVAQSLLERASLAVGAARNDSHQGLRVYEPEMRVTATERFELGADLQGAIGREELSVVYQPIVELATRNVRGVEALLRWSHPERGPISPAVFIPLAEKSGMVVELGRWVLIRACAQLRYWHQNVAGAKRLGVSVNVSALQLEREGEAERLSRIVIESAVDPNLVTVELTESTLIEDGEWIRSQLQTLQDLGIRVAIDDFGTGAAGLSHLRDVPFNVIKIDKSYVDALSGSAEAQRLVRGVIDLAHTLGAKTVAEGIEEPTEFDLLQSLGCELGQGFYLGRPMDPTQLEDWFAKGRTGSVPALIASPTDG